MNLGLQLQPYFPPLWVGAGGVLLLVLWAYVYHTTLRRRAHAGVGLYALRCLLIVALCLLLLGPSLRRATTTHSERSHLSILLDTSASMNTPDIAGETRLEFARRVWLAPERLQALAREADVELFAFDSELYPLARDQLASPLQLRASAAETGLANSLGALLAGANKPGSHSVLVLSDGHDTTGMPLQRAGELASDQRVALHTVALGGQRLQTDLGVHASVAQNFVFAREPANLEVHILQSGTAGEHSELRVTHATTKFTQALVCDGQRELVVLVPIQHDQAGTFSYTVELAPIEGELNTRNNRQELQVRVADGRLRVLLLEGQPFWDTKFLAAALRRDDRIELTQISRLNAGKLELNVTRADAKAVVLPESASDWSHYDVVMLGRGIEDMLERSHADALRQSIEQSGTQLVFTRGRAWDASSARGRAIHEGLAVLEPLQQPPSARRVRRNVELTASGDGHALFSRLSSQASARELFKQLPALDVPERAEGLKAGVIVLARSASAGDGSAQVPLLTVMGYGRGSVLSVLGEGLWQWKLRNVRSQELQAVHDRLWSNTARWLALGSGFSPGESLALRLSRQEIKQKDTIEIDASSREALRDLQLTATAPDGTHQVLALDPAEGGVRYSAHFTALQAGKYRFALHAKLAGRNSSTATAELIAEPDDRELSQTDAQPAALATLSTLSKGKVLDRERPEQLLSLLERGRLETLAPERLDYAWDRTWIMLAILAWPGLEWLLRRRWGLA